MGREPDLAKRTAWQRRLREFDRGSETVADFCARVGVSIATFYLWRRKLKSVRRAARSPARASRPAPLRPGATAHRRSSPGSATAGGMSFLPVEISGRGGVEVLLPDGTRVSVPCHQRAALRTVIVALLRASRAARQAEHRAC